MQNKLCKNSEQVKDRSKTNYVKNCEKRKKQFRANYVKNAKKTKDQSMPKSSQDRINKFKLNIRQGPYFICLYNRSVKLFKIEKYEILHDKSLSLVKSFDSNYHICNTCDRTLNKKKNSQHSVF